MDYIFILATLLGVLTPQSEVVATTTNVEIIEEKITTPESLITETFGANSIMHHVARCESGKRQFQANGEVLRGRQNEKDVGIFQINEFYHLENSKKIGIDIYTPEGNVAYAKYLYDRNGTRDWNWSKECWGK